MRMETRASVDVVRRADDKSEEEVLRQRRVLDRGKIFRKLIMEEVKEVMIMIKHGAIKGRCIQWFSRVVRGLNFRSADFCGVMK